MLLMKRTVASARAMQRGGITKLGSMAAGSSHLDHFTQIFKRRNQTTCTISSFWTKNQNHKMSKLQSNRSRSVFSDSGKLVTIKLLIGVDLDQDQNLSCEHPTSQCVSLRLPHGHDHDESLPAHRHGYHRNYTKHFPLTLSLQARDRSFLESVSANGNVDQRRHASFSPTKAILDSSPASLQPYLRLIRFEKPIGTWLLYWPCTWSIALAAQPGFLPDLKLLILFGAGSFFMRGAGCIINDMWDKDIDGMVERTKSRPLASGELSRFQALVFLGTQLSCALTILLQLNWYSVFLGSAAMIPVILYPLAKRYTFWPQVVLGFTFNYGALLGWAAVQGSVAWPVCLPLYGSAILWTMVYDTIYAHQDKYDDQLIGVKSTALRLGENTKPWLAGFSACMTVGLVGAGFMCDMTWPYYTAVFLTASRLAQQVYSTNLDDADDCARAFKGNFYLGAVLFSGIVLGNLLKSPKKVEDS